MPRLPKLSLFKVSTQTAGVAIGPLFVAPISSLMSRRWTALWSQIGALGCSIWSALMTGHGDYTPFLVARIFSGIFGSFSTMVGSSVIMELFFLHEQGAAFLIYTLSVTFGTISGSTFGGFIEGKQMDSLLLVDSAPFGYRCNTCNCIF